MKDQDKIKNKDHNNDYMSYKPSTTKNANYNLPIKHFSNQYPHKYFHKDP